ncbi:MAG: hypothetical protein J7J70_01390, partial [Deltaproteobacteria bacterium]|nr:hypothetical protein [Candidatus Tharpellaceae bacterium]
SEQKTITGLNRVLSASVRKSIFFRAGGSAKTILPGLSDRAKRVGITWKVFEGGANQDGWFSVMAEM